MLQAEENKHVNICEYLDIPKCLPAADIVICRSGASTLSELQAMGKASILIPSPYVAEKIYDKIMEFVPKT